MIDVFKRKTCDVILLFCIIINPPKSFQIHTYMFNKNKLKIFFYKRILYIFIFLSFANFKVFYLMDEEMCFAFVAMDPATFEAMPCKGAAENLRECARHVIQVSRTNDPAWCTAARGTGT